MVAPLLYLSARADNQKALEPEAAQPVEFTLEAFPVFTDTTSYEIGNGLALDREKLFQPSNQTSPGQR
jgi:hypothetical protein